MIFLFFVIIFCSFVISLLLVRSREIFQSLLYFYLLINFITLCLLIYFVVFVKFNDIINTVFIFILLNMIIALGFVFEGNEE